jgi:hypothetical protein
MTKIVKILLVVVGYALYRLVGNGEWLHFELAFQIRSLMYLFELGTEIKHAPIGR